MDKYQPKFLNCEQFSNKANTKLYADGYKCNDDEHSMVDNGETGFKVNSMHDSLVNWCEPVEYFVRLISWTGSILI